MPSNHLNEQLPLLRGRRVAQSIRIIFFFPELRQEVEITPAPHFTDKKLGPNYLVSQKMLHSMKNEGKTENR